MTAGKNRPKFYRKSRTLLALMLRLVGENTTQAEIGRTLDVHKSSVSYYLKKAQKTGYIRLEVRDAVKILTLTHNGRKFLEMYENDNGLPLLRLENIRFKAQIVQLSDRPCEPDWEKVQMHNWVQYKSKIDEVYVRINEGKNPTIEFQPSGIDGHCPYSIFLELSNECQQVAEKLHDVLGLKIGPLDLSSRPEWAVYDPVAREFCRYNGQITVQGLAKINASAPRSLGEIEFFSPLDAVDYVKMPRKVHDLRGSVSRLEAELKEFKSAWYYLHPPNN